MRALLPLLILLVSGAGAETLHLGEGRVIRGEVVKESADTLFVDVGYTILAVPKKDVLSREADEAPAPPETAGQGQERKAAGEIFSTIDRPELPVRENVVRTEGAVVMVTTPGGLGSGFLISPDGYVVTNDHVVQGETKIAVVLFERGGDGALEKRKIEKVKIVATDPHEDLALLKMEEVKDLPIVYLGDSDELKVGQTVFAIGNPHGLERSVSEGIVSTLNRIMDGRPHIQTTTAVNPGNSGGPLLNLAGEVVGVVDLKLIFSEGLNFAIPVNRLKRFLRDRDAYAYDKDNPNTGFRYLPPPPKAEPKAGQ